MISGDPKQVLPIAGKRKSSLGEIEKKRDLQFLLKRCVRLIRTLSVTSSDSLIIVPVDSLSVMSVTGYSGISCLHNLYSFTRVSIIIPLLYLSMYIWFSSLLCVTWMGTVGIDSNNYLLAT